MSMFKATVLLAFSLTFAACSTPTTYAQRMDTVVPAFASQIDAAAAELQAVQTRYRQANFSADATRILDLLAARISADIVQTRFLLAEAHAEVDADKLELASQAITTLMIDLSELRQLAVR